MLNPKPIIYNVVFYPKDGFIAEARRWHLISAVNGTLKIQKKQIFCHQPSKKQIKKVA